MPEYKGSTLRGAFGSTFKRIVCALRRSECSDCLLREKCIYEYVFETPPPKDAAILRKYPFAPHPFVIEPPLDPKRRIEPGEEFAFGLVLIGRATDYLPYFIYTFEELGKSGIGRGRGKIALEQVCSLGLDGQQEKIYCGAEKVLRGGSKTLSAAEIIDNGKQIAADHLSIEFRTPTRIKYEEGLASELQFHILVRALLRRISLLSYFHCGFELKADYRGLIEHAKAVRVARSDLRWHDWERYSSRQDAKMKLGGITGQIEYEGDLSEFFPYILIGEHVHLGKATSFGLGKYKVFLED